MFYTTANKVKTTLFILLITTKMFYGFLKSKSLYRLKIIISLNLLYFLKCQLIILLTCNIVHNTLIYSSITLLYDYW